MTPPDSDVEWCVICSLPATRGDDESGRKYWCGKHGPFYDKPDSGAPKKRTPEEWRKLADEERRGTEQGMAFLDAVERNGCMARVKPDSDAAICRACRNGDHDNCVIANYRYVQPGPGCACPCPIEQPDSDAREVNPVPTEEVRAFHSHTVCIGWPTIQRLANHGGVYFAEQDVALVAADDLFRNSGTAILPLSLAQRILAALEGEAAFLHNEGKESGSRMLYDVASELRAVIGK